MASLESAIDELYKGPLEAFVAARTLLAKSLTGTDAKRVKSLSKPTAVVWAVNQVYWHARSSYERVTKTGEKLRASQIAALNGRSADLRAANAAHRAAVADAVTAATRLASTHDVRPDPDAIARMFEAVSLIATPQERHGRFTRPLQPAGFEALAGVEIAPVARADQKMAAPSDGPKLRLAERLARDAERERLVVEEKKRTAIRDAQTAVSRAKEVEERAREAWHRARQALDDAERALERSRN